jgi:hypothetical protein
VHLLTERLIAGSDPTSKRRFLINLPPDPLDVIPSRAEE